MLFITATVHHHLPIRDSAGAAAVAGITTTTTPPLVTARSLGGCGIGRMDSCVYLRVPLPPPDRRRRRGDGPTLEQQSLDSKHLGTAASGSGAAEHPFPV